MSLINYYKEPAISGRKEGVKGFALKPICPEHAAPLSAWAQASPACSAKFFVCRRKSYGGLLSGRLFDKLRVSGGRKSVRAERSRSLIPFLFISLLFTSLSAKKFTIMISPEGDTNNSGRTLAEGFERGFTRQYAEALKELLEQDSSIRVILSHDSGEPATQEYKANFANRLEVDLYLSLNFYADEKPSMSIYYYHTALFDAPVDNSRLTLYPTTKAYVKNSAQTKQRAQHWKKLEQYQAQLTINYPLAIPIKQLEGIIAPAYAIELSAQKIADTHTYLQPINTILTDIAHEKNN